MKYVMMLALAALLLMGCSSQTVKPNETGNATVQNETVAASPVNTTIPDCNAEPEYNGFRKWNGVACVTDFDAYKKDCENRGTTCDHADRSTVICKWNEEIQSCSSIDVALLPADERAQYEKPCPYDCCDYQDAGTYSWKECSDGLECQEHKCV